MAEMTIGGIRTAQDTAPYVIAEIGVNHEGSVETAKLMIEQAKRGGAHAAKFQTYKAETLASRHSPAYWDLGAEPTSSQFQLFKKHDSFSDDDYKELARHCEHVGIHFMSTPFDDHAVDLLDPLVPAFKIASADLTNLPLLRRVAATGKPVILSTGASTLAEIDLAVMELEQLNVPQLGLLHCVLNYPCQYENAHLGMINGLARAYPQYLIGYSDHTHPDHNMAILTAAYVKGARILEKHFTHDKALPGNDHYHAMDESDLVRFTEITALLRQAEGDPYKHALESEKPARENARRSIVTTRTLPAGTIVGTEDITYKRPGTGISPLHWDSVIGMAVRHDLEDDHVLSWTDLLPTKDVS